MDNEERFTFTYDPEILDIDIENTLARRGRHRSLHPKNAEYLKTQPLARKEMICEQVIRQLWDEEDFQEILSVVVNEIVGKYRKYEEAANIPV
jgi:hypothetical protein